MPLIHLLFLILLIFGIWRRVKRKKTKGDYTKQAVNILNAPSIKDYQYLMKQASQTQNVYLRGAYSFKINLFYLAQIQPLHIENDDNFPTGFYSPQRIVFHDILEKEICSILSLNGKLEVIKAQKNKNKNVPIHAIPKKPEFVTNKDLLAKVYHSFQILLEMKKLEEKIEKQEKKAMLQAQSLIPPLKEEKKAAFKRLATLCTNADSAKKIHNFIDTLKETDELEAEQMTYEKIEDFCHSLDINFITSLDWKFEVEDFEYFINECLTKNYPSSLQIDILNRLDENQIVVGSPGVFKEYDQVLRAHGFTMAFIENPYDAYTLFIIRLAQEEQIKQTIESCGLVYGNSMHYYF